MSGIAVIMMVLFMTIIWGGFIASAIRITRVGETPAAIYLAEHPEADV